MSEKLSAEAILEKLKPMIVEIMGVNPEIILPATSLEEMGADSLDVVEIVMAVEEEFQVDIPDEDAEKLSTVQHWIDYISNKLP